MQPSEARERLAAARVARLATVGASGHPHIVPVCFALHGDTIYSAVDHKPKRTERLRRLENVRANPAAAVLADHYEDGDWRALWWVRADASARILDAPADAAEAEQARALLGERYAQYRRRPPAGAVLALDVRRWAGWRGDGA